MTRPIHALTSLLMRGGKKRLIAKKLLTNIQSSGWKNTCTLTGAIYKLRPILETRKVRKGSKYYDVPFYISRNRSRSIVYRWLAKSLDKPRANLDQEWKEIVLDEGYANKESEILIQRVAANMRYSHYRWK